MKNRAYLLLALSLTLCVGAAQETGTFVPCEPGAKIFVVNGIRTSSENASQNADELKKAVAHFGVTCVADVVHVHNPSAWYGIADLLEAANQKAAELSVPVSEAFVEVYLAAMGHTSTLSASERDAYTEMLAGLVRGFSGSTVLYSQISDMSASKVVAAIQERIEEEISANRKIVLVGHSQGNFFVNEAFERIASRGDTPTLKALSVVNVSNVTLKAPSNLTVSVYQDSVVKWLGPLALPANFDATGADTWGHGFIEVYLNRTLPSSSPEGNSVAAEVTSLIQRAINSTQFPSPRITSVTCSAPVVRQEMTCTISGAELPATTSFDATNCGPTPMTPVPGGMSTRRQFICLPVAAGLPVVVQYSVPGYAGELPMVPIQVAAAAPPPPPALGALNDTGIGPTQCFASPFGNDPGGWVLEDCASQSAMAVYGQQDGMVGRDVGASSGADGRLGFSFSLVSRPEGGFFDVTECVRDNVTGLTWEGKPTTGPRAASVTLQNYGLPVGPAYDYVQQVKAEKLCGFSDWRLPNREELLSLVDYGATTGPAIDLDWFPNTQATPHWTATIHMDSRSPFGATEYNLIWLWHVDFATGRVSASSAITRFSIRLVR